MHSHICDIGLFHMSADWLHHYLPCIHRFLGHENQDTFFVDKDRSRIVYEVLATSAYGKRKRAEIGIDRLLEEEAYQAAFPLHIVSSKRERVLYKGWSLVRGELLKLNTHTGRMIIGRWYLPRKISQKEDHCKPPQ